MDISKEKAIDDLLAKWEIHEVMMRYCRGVNRLEPEIVKSCYHPDAYEDHGASQGNSWEYSKGFTPEKFKSFKMMFHHVGTEIIELDGDRAAHEAYFIGCHRYDDENGIETDMFFGGRYLSVFERRNGGPWLIADRTVVHDWSRVEPITTPWEPASLFKQGLFSPEDLVFRLLDEHRVRPATT